MRTAVCISGQARLIDTTHKSIMNLLVKPFEADVFCCFWDEPEGRKAIDKFEPKKFKLIPPKDLVTNFMKNYPHKGREKVLREGGFGRRPRKNVLNMWYMIYKCNGIKKKHEKELKYDCVVRVRPDLRFSRVNDLYLEGENILHLSSHGESHKGYNDQFAYGSSELMDRYSSLWKHMHERCLLAESKRRSYPETCPFYYNWLAPEVFFKAFVDDVVKPDKIIYKPIMIRLMRK